MITPEQENWIAHLNDTDRVEIAPFDPNAELIFSRIKHDIQKHFGREIAVEHHGASRLRISGQDEIDIYVPVPPDNFDATIAILTELYGNPRSNYPLKRARFGNFIEGKRVDVFVINEQDSGWTDSLFFEKYLLEHAEALEQYRLLKESLAGKSTREYYRNKIAFINSIIEKAKTAS